MGEVFDYAQSAEAFRLKLFDVWLPGVVRVEAEAKELDGIRYWDGSAVGKGNLGFLFFNMMTFDWRDKLRKPYWENQVWMGLVVVCCTPWACCWFVVVILKSAFLS